MATQEIIWTDQATGQKFVIDDTGEKIFILADGSRVYESDLILDELLAAYEEEEEEKSRNEEAEKLFEEELLEEIEEQEAEDQAERGVRHRRPVLREAGAGVRGSREGDRGGQRGCQG